MRPLRKALIGVALTGATLVGGAIGASMVGTASAQTTTTTPPDSNSGTSGANGAAPHDKENCPLDANGNPVAPRDAPSTSTETPAT